jgi:HK97 family phage prohead protease
VTDIQHKSIAFEVKREPDQDGVFEGYASVFDIVDGGMDVVSRGAFTKSIATRKPKMLWQHDTSQIIGVWDEVREDERGLFVKGRLLKDVQKGREAMALMRVGAIDSMSIGYKTIAATEEGSGAVRRLLELDLFEVSVVTFPMLEAAKITDIKSIKTERDFEAFLRDAGYSRKDATAIALHGYKALEPQRDAEAKEAENGGLRDIIEQLSQLQRSISNVG